MGLIILIVTGVLLGWLATIALQVEDGPGILRNVVAGLLGSLVVGIGISGGVLLGAVRATTLLWAMLGAIVLIAVYNVMRHRAWR